MMRAAPLVLALGLLSCQKPKAEPAQESEVSAVSAAAEALPPKTKKFLDWIATRGWESLKLSCEDGFCRGGTFESPVYNAKIPEKAKSEFIITAASIRGEIVAKCPQAWPSELAVWKYASTTKRLCGSSSGTTLLVTLYPAESMAGLGTQLFVYSNGYLQHDPAFSKDISEGLRRAGVTPQ